MAAEPQSEVFAPVLTIVRSLVVFLLLALVAAFVLAHRHIRHATRPLEALRDATRRVASGDLETPVAITSSDEYGELASAFDVMTGELGRQFRLMRSLEAVDEATLRERKVHAIAEVAVSRFIGDESCSRVVLVLVDPDARNRALRWQLDSAEPRIQSEAVRLTEAELARLGELPRASVCSSAALPAICEAAATPAFGTDARVVLPLQQNGRLLGILVLAFRSTPEIGSAAVLSARRIADRITLGISNVRLLEHVSSLSEGALLAFARAIDANSHWTAGHSERVTAVALQLGRTLHLDQYALETLARGGIMHDVGKIGIPTAVIDKNGRLTNAERAVIEQHPLIGETILKPISALSDALPIVRSHHEKWDGTGYPDRLAGEDIPWLARILAAADVLDALTSDRPYRVGMSVDDAVRIITDGSGTHFDLRVVEALRSLDRDRLLAPFATNTVSVLPNAAASSHELIFASAL